MNMVSKVYHEKEEDTRQKSWSNLMPELLCSIAKLLYAGDSVTFHAICKSWHLARPTIRSLPPEPDLHQTPCLNFSGNRFFHPIYNAFYRMEIPQQFSDAPIRASNYGWLLLTPGERGAFFFNYFTNVLIKLPDLPEMLYDCYQPMSFSSPPTSSDCVVFGFSCITDKNTFFCSIRRGEEQWTIQEFEKSKFFLMGNPILYKGSYYCLGFAGNLLVYVPEENNIHWIAYKKSIARTINNVCPQGFLVESDGDLIAVLVTARGTWIRVWKLNLSRLVWETVPSLGNKMLFVSHPSCFSETANVKGTGNKIYLPMYRDNNGLFYSLDTGRYHSFADGCSYDNFDYCKRPLNSTWIKPMTVKGPVCREEIVW